VVLPSSNLQLGILTHDNDVIFANAIENVTLSTVFSFNSTVSGPFTQVLKTDVQINETPNNPGGGNCPDGGVPPCPDVIILTPNAANEVIPIPGSSEFIVFTPLFRNEAGVATDRILTLEDSTNTFTFVGNFTVAPSPAPVGGIALLSLFSGKFRRLRERLQEHHEVQV
jgi:hypothetical protein